MPLKIEFSITWLGVRLESIRKQWGRVGSTTSARNHYGLSWKQIYRHGGGGDVTMSCEFRKKLETEM